MAATLMAATASTSTVLRPNPFLGQSRASNANPLRDVVSIGTPKYTMVYSLSLSLSLSTYTCKTIMAWFVYYRFIEKVKMVEGEGKVNESEEKKFSLHVFG